MTKPPSKDSSTWVLRIGSKDKFAWISWRTCSRDSGDKGLADLTTTGFLPLLSSYFRQVCSRIKGSKFKRSCRPRTRRKFVKNGDPKGATALSIRASLL